MLKASKYKDSLAEIMKEIKNLFADTSYETYFKDFEQRYRTMAKREKIHVVVCGEYSTGKTSIISAMLNREDLGIDTDVKTSKAMLYDYNGFCIIDTPGLLSGYVEHTNIAQSTIEDADAVIYCITSEWFVPETRKIFYDILRRERYKRKVILVINKIDANFTGEDICTMLMRYQDRAEAEIKQGGFEPYDVTICCVSTKWYFDGKKANNQGLIDISYMTDFFAVFEEGDFLLHAKCNKQISLILDFLQEILEENRNDITSEERKEQEKQRSILRNQLRNVEREVVCHANILFRECDDTVKKEIYGMIQEKCLTEEAIMKCLTQNIQETYKKLEIYTYKACEQIEQQLMRVENIFYDFGVAEVDKIKKIKTIKEKERNSRTFLGEGFKVAENVAGGIVTSAKPVRNKIFGFIPIGKLSKEGGKGTALYNVIAKCFPEETAGKISIKLAKGAKVISENAQVLGIAAKALDIIFMIGGEMADSKNAKKKQQLWMKCCTQIEREVNKNKERFIENFGGVTTELNGQIDKLGVVGNEFECGINDILRKVIELNNILTEDVTYE